MRRQRRSGNGSPLFLFLPLFLPWGLATAADPAFAQGSKGVVDFWARRWVWARCRSMWPLRRSTSW